MNKGESGLSALQNKNESVFAGRHNAALRLFVYRPTLLPNIFSGNQNHHDKTSARAACHDSYDGDAIRQRAIARANRTAGDGAGAA
jgi:hypothetical protein